MKISPVIIYKLARERCFGAKESALFINDDERGELYCCLLIYCHCYNVIMAVDDDDCVEKKWTFVAAAIKVCEVINSEQAN
jgi:hypothetical protein